MLTKMFFTEKSSLLHSQKEGKLVQEKKIEEIKKLITETELNVVQLKKDQSKAFLLQSQLQVLNDINKHVEFLKNTVDGLFLQKYKLTNVMSELAFASQQAHYYTSFAPDEESREADEKLRNTQKNYHNAIDTLPSLIQKMIDKKQDTKTFLENETATCKQKMQRV